MTSPPTTAPMIESSPPRITAGNTLMPKKESAGETPLTTPTTTPARADTIAEIPHERAKTCRTEMPSDWATCWLNAVALMASPMREYLKNQAKLAMIAMLISVDMTYTVLILSPRRFTSGVVKIGGNGCAETPNSHFIKAWKKIDS